MLTFFSIILCLLLAGRLSRGQNGNDVETDSWCLAKRSLRTGMLLVTVPLLGYFGLERYMNGTGIPSLYVLIVCIGLVSLVMTGAGIEISGNVVIDSLLVSGLLVAGCFTVINGIPEAARRLNVESFCSWFLACVISSIVVRAVIWAGKGK